MISAIIIITSTVVSIAGLGLFIHSSRVRNVQDELRIKISELRSSKTQYNYKVKRAVAAVDHGLVLRSASTEDLLAEMYDILKAVNFYQYELEQAAVEGSTKGVKDLDTFVAEITAPEGNFTGVKNGNSSWNIRLDCLLDDLYSVGQDIAQLDAAF